jgi:hypothetical protein
VLPAIGLDDQARILAEEVDDKLSDWNLAAEFEPEQPTISQVIPEALF